MSHYAQLVVELTILALAIFLGVEVISKVPTLLHTPLMSGTNAIHGIVIVGAILIALVPDISGVCSSVGTFEITSTPRKIARARIVSSTTSCA